MSQTLSFETSPAPADAPATTAPVTTEAPANDRPAWLPENFKDGSALAASYAELQSELGRLRAAQKPAETPAAETPPAASAPPAEAPAEDAAKADLAAKGVDFDALATEFMTGGALSDESYAKLEAAGYPKAVVDDYIGLKVEKSEALVTSLKAEVGGDAEFAKLSAWAGSHYTDAQKAAYNAAVESGDAGQMSQAVRALNAAYRAARGEAPELLSGSAPAGSGGGVYRDMSEFLADMADDRYSKSEAFRADVQSKLKRSNI